MPWSNHNGGPWGQKGGSGNDGGGKTPWGSGGGGGGKEPPNFEDLLRQSQDKLKNIFGGGGGNGGSAAPSFGGKGAALVVLGAIALWLLTGFYIVAPNQMGVNLIFGRYSGSTGQGLSYNLPYPIGQVQKYDVTAQQSVEVGFSAAGRAPQRDLLRESLMLTGDENIVDVSFFVVWQVDPANIKNYAFTLADKEGTIKVVAESAMREVVGRSNLQAIIGSDQTRIVQLAQEIVQQTLDGYNAGILIKTLQFKAAVPPEQVQAAFRDVRAAQQDASRVQQEANRDASQIVPKAYGEAAGITQTAEGYKAQMLAEATGQAVYFRDVLKSYQTAPDIIRKRIYLETMERIFKDSDKTIIDQKQSGTGVIPFLPLAQTGAK